MIDPRSLSCTWLHFHFNYVSHGLRYLSEKGSSYFVCDCIMLTWHIGHSPRSRSGRKWNGTAGQKTSGCWWLLPCQEVLSCSVPISTVIRARVVESKLQKGRRHPTGAAARYGKLFMGNFFRFYHVRLFVRAIVKLPQCHYFLLQLNLWCIPCLVLLPMLELYKFRYWHPMRSNMACD